MRILESFGIAQYFNAIYGDRIDYASHSKSDLLALVLSRHAVNQDGRGSIGLDGG